MPSHRSFHSSAVPTENIVKWLVVAVVLVNLIVFALVGVSLYQSREQAQAQADVTTRNLSRVLEASIAGDLNKVDLALLTTRDEMERRLASGIVDPLAVNHFFAQQLKYQPGLTGLRATDAKGVVRYGTDVKPAGGPNNSDREYFIRGRDDAQAGLIISKSIFARIDKKWVLVLARRYNYPDGSFAGVVYGTLGVEHFAENFGRLDIGRKGAVALRDRDLDAVARYPALPEGGSGGKVSAELRRRVISGQNEGTYRTVTPIDNTMRVLSFLRVEDKPLYIVVGLASEDYFAEWRRQAPKIIFLAVLFFLGTLLSSWLIHRAWRGQLAIAEALSEQRGFLDAILENEPECVTVIASDGNLLQMNRAGLEMFEVDSIDQARERGLACFVQPAYLDVFQGLIRGVLDGEPGILEFPIQGSRGTLRWLDTHASPLVNNKGEVVALIGVTRDVTERKRAEAALRQLNETLGERVKTEVAKNMAQERLLIHQSRLAAMGEMIGNIAHQWRQPLHALTLLLANIKDDYAFGELDEKSLASSVTNGQAMIQKMSDTIDDFRNFFLPNKEKVDFVLSAAVMDAVHLVEHGLQNNSIALHVDEVPDIRAFGFPNEFSQVLLNVFTNAKEAILERRREGGDIEVAMGQDEENLWVTVRDNAGGISENILPKIFDPYFTTKERGTGIGLYMSKMIMDHMGGRIEARNTGDGAEFKLLLPRIKTEGITVG